MMSKWWLSKLQKRSFVLFSLFRPADVASPDLAIIEDDLNLEELMKQKALLQARLGAYMSDTEGDDSRSQREMEHTLPVKCTESSVSNKYSKRNEHTTTANSKHNLNRISKDNESDVILLDDSSGDRCTPERFDRQQNTVRQMDESGEKRTAHETSPLYVDRLADRQIPIVIIVAHVQNGRTWNGAKSRE
ncbi:uncharacterized protein ACN427_000828 isoform 1-T5 [Glossina fuscipes fuscipes]